MAERFGKRHDHVLRDIDTILGPGGIPKIGDTPWFREICTTDPQNGQSYRSFDMTEEGFSLLVMGWTGERAWAKIPPASIPKAEQ